MVVTEVHDRAPLEAVSHMTADLAVRIHERHGVVWPVSGDLTAVSEEHIVRRDRDMQAPRPRRWVVATGRLHRADGVQLVEVQCTDCPWSLKVHGWDAGADRLAQRHADSRQHAVMQTVVR